MISIAAFEKIALSFPEVTAQPHFEKPSYRIAKKIFATLDVKNKRACIKLSEADQDIFSSFDKAIIFPVPNKWGKQGWTFIDLTAIKAKMLKAALTTAYCEVAPKKLAALVQIKEEE